MKVRVILAAIMLMGSSLVAEETQNQTSLCFISSKGDFIGGGNSVSLSDQDAEFFIQATHRGIQVRVSNEDEWWNLEFAGPDGAPLQVGAYVGAARFPFNDEHPGLSIHGCHRGCNRLSGDFEILELKYGVDGKIESFAANFIQKCEETMPPLSGCVRYNSAFPAEIKYLDKLKKQTDFQFSVFKHSYSTGKVELTHVDQESAIKIVPLKILGDGIKVMVDTEDGLWEMYFATPLFEELEVGLYSPTQKYPFHSMTRPGMDIIDTDGSFTQSRGCFEILEIVRDENGRIKSLALDFIAVSQDDESLEGSIRYNSSKELKPIYTQ